MRRQAILFVVVAAGYAVGSQLAFSWFGADGTNASFFPAAGVSLAALVLGGAPRGTFILSETGRPVLLISAGVGATPLLAMLHALAAERSRRQVWWLHGARGGGDHVFAAESRALLEALPKARGHVCFSRPGPGDREGRDFQTAGRLSAALLAALGPPSDADADLCGPAPFMDVPVRWSCRTGVFHTCETALVSGAVDHDPEPVEPPAEGTALICCARPRGDVVLDL